MTNKLLGKPTILLVSAECYVCKKHIDVSKTTGFLYRGITVHVRCFDDLPRTFRGNRL